MPIGSAQAPASSYTDCLPLTHSDASSEGPQGRGLGQDGCPGHRRYQLWRKSNTISRGKNEGSAAPQRLPQLGCCSKRTNKSLPEHSSCRRFPKDLDGLNNDTGQREGSFASAWGMPAGPQHLLLPGSLNKELGGGGMGAAFRKGAGCLLGMLPSPWKEVTGSIRQLLPNLRSFFSG